MELIYVAVGLIALLSVITPKPKVQGQKPAAFEDIDFPLCEEGEEQSAVFGQVWSKGWMVLTVGNYRTQAIKTKGSKK